MGDRRFETVIKVIHTEPNNIYPNSRESMTVVCDQFKFSESYSYKLNEGPTGRETFVRDSLRGIAEKLTPSVKNNENEMRELLQEFIDTDLLGLLGVNAHRAGVVELKMKAKQLIGGQ